MFDDATNAAYKHDNDDLNGLTLNFYDLIRSLKDEVTELLEQHDTALDIAYSICDLATDVRCELGNKDINDIDVDYAVNLVNNIESLAGDITI